MVDRTVSPIALSYSAALALVTVAAWLFSGTAARRATTLYLAAQLATVLLYEESFRYVAIGPALVDCLLLIGIVWTTLQHHRPWLIILSTLQLVTVFGHLARATDPNVWPLAYAIMVQWTAWPSLIVVATGTWSDRKRATDI